MQKFNITGMSCAACSARVERVVKKVQGVKSCSVSLLTNSMTVDGTALPEEIIAAVEKAGYGASLEKAKEVKVKKSDEENYAKRLISSIIFLIILM